MQLLYPKTQHGVIFRSEYDLYGYQGWPSVCRGANGLLYTVWSGFRMQHICPFGKTAMSVSPDEGKTWSRPMIVNDTVLDDRDAGIVHLGENRLLLTWFTHTTKNYLQNYYDGILSTASEAERPLVKSALEYYRSLPEQDSLGGSYVRVSENAGLTWSEKIRVPVTAPHGPNVLSDGTVLYLGKVNDFEMDGRRCPVCAYASYDGGYTYEFLSELELPEGTRFDNFHEPHVLELPGGRLLGAIRAQGRNLEPDFTVYLSVSDDKGKTWTTPQPTGFVGSPPHLLRHSSGALICTYGRRKESFGERAAVSRDNGLTWNEEYVLCEGLPDHDLGYPATVELSDASLLTVYYQKCPGDRKTSISYTKWSL